MPDALPAPRDVSGLLGWLAACTPGTLIPAVELRERVESLPVVNGAHRAQKPDEPERLLTADEVADWLSMNPQSVYRMAREGRLRKVQVSDNTVRFRPSDVEAWIDERSA